MLSVTRGQFLRGDWQEQPISPSPAAVARIKPNCLTHQGIFCHTCGEVCEPDAISFVPVVGRVPTPGVDEDACTGCGECVGICPADAIALKQRQTKETL
jgi:ferredoxin-type protein NapF